MIALWTGLLLLAGIVGFLWYVARQDRLDMEDRDESGW